MAVRVRVRRYGVVPLADRVCGAFLLTVVISAKAIKPDIPRPDFPLLCLTDTGCVEEGVRDGYQTADWG